MSDELTFRYWWTKVEYSKDKKTGAFAALQETPGGWRWSVKTETETTHGSSTTQKGARAACRRLVRKKFK